MADTANRCRRVSLRDALAAFVFPPGRTQSQGHIKPLHWHVACRLVVEGGFSPEEITPRPPFAVEPSAGGPRLIYRPEAAGGGERTVLGGLKTKDLDVTAVKPDVGPCLAVSIKGTLNAFRNLTNRMEEAAGDCTNLHIAYPNLVYGFLHILRGNREGRRAVEERGFLRADAGGDLAANDLALRSDGSVVDAIRRYHDVLLGLSGRSGIRNDLTRYESVGVALALPDPPSLMTDWPDSGSPLRFETFFDRLYREYDRRYVFAAPRLAARTERLVWRADSPALLEPMADDYAPRSDGDP